MRCLSTAGYSDGSIFGLQPVHSLDQGGPPNVLAACMGCPDSEDSAMVKGRFAINTAETNHCRPGNKGS